MTTNMLFLGPDRVGKTTLIREVAKLMAENHSVIDLHFSGPGPGDVNPIMQYLVPLQESKKKNPNYILFDRGPQETLFYELIRRKTEIPRCYYNVMEHTLNQVGTTYVFLLYREWDKMMVKLHEEELSLNENIEPLTLEGRRFEHVSYYPFMDEIRASSILHWVDVPMKEWHNNSRGLANKLFSTFAFGNQSTRPHELLC